MICTYASSIAFLCFCFEWHVSEIGAEYEQIVTMASYYTCVNYSAHHMFPTLYPLPLSRALKLAA